MRGKIRNKTNVILALVAVMVMGFAGSTCTEVKADVIPVSYTHLGKRGKYAI